jgi:hypothetical protein
LGIQEILNWCEIGRIDDFNHNNATVCFPAPPSL